MAHRRAEQAAFPAALQRGIPVVAFTTTRWNTLQGGKGSDDSAPDGGTEDTPPTTGDCVAFAASHPAVHHALNSCRSADELAEVAARGPAILADVELEKWRAFGDAFYARRKSSAFENI